ncbi:unnamed protein product [Cuscuta campestris]|uniref:ATG8-interacting protein 1 n=1 Tax=Cuscuta campestris TaxID=132261 RepID=A0A484NR51_9ASTE|nr:unnamed protein product [Cuscuta campestris]
MASNETEEEAAHGSEWEVVSLTASEYEYAASGELNGREEYEGQTSNALFMSHHFALPPSSQHEYLQPEPEKNEILTQQVVIEPEFVSADGGGNTGVNNQEHLETKKLSSSEFPGMQIFNEKAQKGDQLCVSGAECEDDATRLDRVDKEPRLYGTAAYSTVLQGEANMSVLGESIPASNDPLESLPQQVDILDFPDEKKHDGDDRLPCQAWWKRQAASLIAHAKEANTFWSVFIAAAVMGLVIIGQCWQHERWLQSKWQQLGLHEERMCKMVGPLSRLRNAIIGGERRGSSLRSSTPAQR